MKTTALTIFAILFSFYDAFTQVNGVGAGNSLLFDGVTDNLTSTNQVLPLGAKTISLWIRTPDTPQQTLLDNMSSSSANNGTDLLMTGGGTVRFISGRGSAGNLRFDITTTQAVDTDEWIHIAATWNGTTAANGVSIYINGSLNVQGTATHTEIVNATNNLMIGETNFYNLENFEGEMDEISIWNRALTQTGNSRFDE